MSFGSTGYSGSALGTMRKPESRSISSLATLSQRRPAPVKLITPIEPEVGPSCGSRPEKPPGTVWPSLERELFEYIEMFTTISGCTLTWTMCPRPFLNGYRCRKRLKPLSTFPGSYQPGSKPFSGHSNTTGCASRTSSHSINWKA